MNEDIMKKLGRVLEDPKGLSLEQMEDFVHEMLRFFDQLKNILSTGNEEEKKEALKSAYDIQDKLQELAKKAYDQAGLSEEEIKRLLASGAFPDKNLKVFKKAQEEIQEYRQGLHNRDDLNL